MSLLSGVPGSLPGSIHSSQWPILNLSLHSPEPPILPAVSQVPTVYLLFAVHGQFYLVGEDSGSSSPRGNRMLGFTFFPAGSAINFNKTPNFFSALPLAPKGLPQLPLNSVTSCLPVCRTFFFLRIQGDPGFQNLPSQVSLHLPSLCSQSVFMEQASLVYTAASPASPHPLPQIQTKPAKPPSPLPQLHEINHSASPKEI